MQEPEDQNPRNLQQKDCKSAQMNDPDISTVIQLAQGGVKPKGDLSEYSDTVRKYFREWSRLQVIDNVLYRNAVIDGMDIRQIVLPSSLHDIAIKGLHTDVGHPGRD